MKWWYHVVASVLGFSLAALIVFLVFGRADQSARPDSASGPGRSSELRAGCGSILPSALNDASTLKAARSNLPPITNNGALVGRLRTDEENWFARLSAASGLCITDVKVTDTTLSARSVYPDDTPVATADQFTYAIVTRAFERPLNRNAVKVETTVERDTRMVALTASAWRSFQRVRIAQGLPASIQGLKASRSSTDYGRSLVIRGW